MFESFREKVKTEITYNFYKNYKLSFYKIKNKIDLRQTKLKVTGSKMNFYDFESTIDTILDKLENSNYYLNNQNLNNVNNIVNYIINNIITLNQSYENYNVLYLYLKIKNKVSDNSKLSFTSFEKKYNFLKNNQTPFYLILYPNYEWVNLVIGLDQV